MSFSLVICPVCTEFGITPISLKQTKNGEKFLCQKCSAEYLFKVTKKPTFEKF